MIQLGAFMKNFCLGAGALVAALSLATGAVAAPTPNARPLSEANIERLGSTPVSVTGTEIGVGKAWYYTEVNGGGAGIAGAIGGAIAAAIINAAPSARAHRQASEVAELITAEALDSSLITELKSVATPARDHAVTFGDVALTPRPVKLAPLDDVVEIRTTYTLSEDSSVLRVVATATYKNAAIPYQTPYPFKKKPPSSETKGPLYRNVFTYYSTPLPLPVLSPELKDRLVASVQDNARDASGALPVEGSKEYKSLQRDVEDARDDKFSPAEMSVFLTREWLKDGGAKVTREVQAAHAFIAKYALLDMNRTAVPSVTGEDELLATEADDRTVRRIGSGVEAGAYVSSAANVTAPATYGTAVAVGKATDEYVRGLKRQEKAK